MKTHLLYKNKKPNFYCGFLYLLRFQKSQNTTSYKGEFG